MAAARSVIFFWFSSIWRNSSARKPVDAAAVGAGAAVVIGRSSFLVRRLAFPLSVAASAAGLFVFTRFPVGATLGAGQALGWLQLFLVSAAVLCLLGLYLFDVHLGRKGTRLPPLLPAVA